MTCYTIHPRSNKVVVFFLGGIVLVCFLLEQKACSYQNRSYFSPFYSYTIISILNYFSQLQPGSLGVGKTFVTATLLAIPDDGDVLNWGCGPNFSPFLSRCFFIRHWDLSPTFSRLAYHCEWYSNLNFASQSDAHWPTRVSEALLSSIPLYLCAWPQKKPKNKLKHLLCLAFLRPTRFCLFLLSTFAALAARNTRLTNWNPQNLTHLEFSARPRGTTSLRTRQRVCVCFRFWNFVVVSFVLSLLTENYDCTPNFVCFTRIVSLPCRCS